jgi:hypothetical protein
MVGSLVALALSSEKNFSRCRKWGGQGRPPVQGFSLFTGGGNAVMTDSSEKRFRELQNRGGHIVPPVHGLSFFQGGDSAAIISLLEEGLRMTTAIVAGG